MFKLDLNKNGIRINDGTEHDDITWTAIASLEIAVNSFLETYREVRYSLNLELIGTKWGDSAEENLCVSSSYQAKYLQIIFHFHHFLELIIKDVLRSIHPLLATKINSDNSSSLMKLIEGENVEPTNNDTVEFNSALKRISTLPSDSKWKGLSRILTLKRNAETLKILNTLRNKAWHRGVFILKYTELDKFIGANVLPLVLAIIYNTFLWMNKEVFTYSGKGGLEPVLRLIKAAQSKDVDHKEIAFFKEISLSIRNIPRKLRTINGVKMPSLSEVRARSRFEIGGILEIRKCFVCGEKTMLLHDECDNDEDSWWWYVYKIHCENCGLDLYHDLGNPKDYGIDEEDIWLSGNGVR